MKNIQQRGSAGTVLLVIILIVIIVGAFYLYEKNKAIVTPPANVVTTTTPTSGTNTNTGIATGTGATANDGWKTYSNATYGFSFMYPATWTVTEDDNKKEVTVTSDTMSGDPVNMPLEVLSFAATDKSFFNPPIGSKYGEISYDSTLMTLVDASETPTRCLPASPIFGATGAVDSITYAGSMMSDPAYINSAITLANGDIILADEDYEVSNTDQTANTTAKADVAKIADSFTLLNGNSVAIATCAQQ